MKIHPLCWSLLLASTFALAACNNGTNDNAEPGTAAPATVPSTPTEPTTPMMPPPASTTMPPPSSTAGMPAPTSTSPTSGGTH